jgi:rhamnose transport system substrate-binding protein
MKKFAVITMVFALTIACVLTAGAKDIQDMQVCFIPKNTGNPYFDSIDRGFLNAAEKLGYQYETVAPAKADATSQIPFIKTQIQRGVDILGVYPNSVDAMNRMFQQAIKKNVKVFMIGSDINGVENRDVAIMPVDMAKIGPSLVELEGSLIGYEGKIAILSGTADSPDHNFWIAGMKEAIKTNPKYKNMEIVTIAYGNDDPQKSLTEAEGLMMRYPDLRGIIAPTTVAVAAAAQAVENLGKASAVAVTGLGTPNQMRRFLKDGIIKGFILWDPADMGFVGGHMGVLMVQGKLKPAEGVSFDVPGLGKKTFLKDNVIIAGDLITFTKENIDNYNF